MQIQEKLLVFSERLAEAHQIRNELCTLELLEQKKIDDQITEKQEKLKKKLEKKFEKEIKEQHWKNEKKENKMRIKYQHEKDRLDKEIKLHLNEITKYQNLGKKLAIVKGTQRDEFRRTKKNLTDLNDFIKSVRKTPRVFYENLSKSQNFSNIKKNDFKTSLNSLPLIYTSLNSGSFDTFSINKNVLTRFDIKSDKSILDTPVNARPGFLDMNNFSTKTDKILQQSRKEKILLPSLSLLYNNDLILKENYN